MVSLLNELESQSPGGDGSGASNSPTDGNSEEPTPIPSSRASPVPGEINGDAAPEVVDTGQVCKTLPSVDSKEAVDKPTKDISVASSSEGKKNSTESASGDNKPDLPILKADNTGDKLEKSDSILNDEPENIKSEESKTDPDSKRLTDDSDDVQGSNKVLMKEYVSNDQTLDSPSEKVDKKYKPIERLKSLLPSLPSQSDSSIPPCDNLKAHNSINSSSSTDSLSYVEPKVSGDTPVIPEDKVQEKATESRSIDPQSSDSLTPAKTDENVTISGKKEKDRSFDKKDSQVDTSCEAMEVDESPTTIQGSDVVNSVSVMDSKPDPEKSNSTLVVSSTVVSSVEIGNSSSSVQEKEFHDEKMEVSSEVRDETCPLTVSSIEKASLKDSVSIPSIVKSVKDGKVEDHSALDVGASSKKITKDLEGINTNENSSEQLITTSKPTLAEDGKPAKTNNTSPLSTAADGLDNAENTAKLVQPITSGTSLTLSRSRGLTDQSTSIKSEEVCLESSVAGTSDNLLKVSALSAMCSKIVENNTQKSLPEECDTVAKADDVASSSASNEEINIGISRVPTSQSASDQSGSTVQLKSHSKENNSGLDFDEKSKAQQLITPSQSSSKSQLQQTLNKNDLPSSESKLISDKVDSVSSDKVKPTSDKIDLASSESKPSSEKLDSASSISDPKPTSDKVNLAPSESKSTSDKVNLASSESKPTSDNVILASSESKPASDNVNLASSESKPASDNVNLASSESKPTSDKVNLVLSDSKPTSDKVNLSSSESKPASDNVNLASSESKPASDNVNLASSDSKPTSDKVNLASSESKPTSDKVNLASSESKSTSDKGNLTSSEPNPDSDIVGLASSIPEPKLTFNKIDSPLSKSDSKPTSHNVSSSILEPKPPPHITDSISSNPESEADSSNLDLMSTVQKKSELQPALDKSDLVSSPQNKLDSIPADLGKPELKFTSGEPHSMPSELNSSSGEANKVLSTLVKPQDKEASSCQISSSHSKIELEPTSSKPALDSSDSTVLSRPDDKRTPPVSGKPAAENPISVAKSDTQADNKNSQSQTNKFSEKSKQISTQSESVSSTVPIQGVKDAKNSNSEEKSNLSESGSPAEQKSEKTEISPGTSLIKIPTDADASKNMLVPSSSENKSTEIKNKKSDKISDTKQEEMELEVKNATDGPSFDSSGGTESGVTKSNETLQTNLEKKVEHTSTPEVPVIVKSDSPASLNPDKPATGEPILKNDESVDDPASKSEQSPSLEKNTKQQVDPPSSSNKCKTRRDEEDEPEQSSKKMKLEDSSNTTVDNDVPMKDAEEVKLSQEVVHEPVMKITGEGEGSKCETGNSKQNIVQAVDDSRLEPTSTATYFRHNWTNFLTSETISSRFEIPPSNSRCPNSINPYYNNNILSSVIEKPWWERPGTSSESRESYDIIEEPVMFIWGEGAGEDCLAGNSGDEATEAVGSNSEVEDKTAKKLKNIQEKSLERDGVGDTTNDTHSDGICEGKMNDLDNDSEEKESIEESKRNLISPSKSLKDNSNKVNGLKKDDGEPDSNSDESPPDSSEVDNKEESNETSAPDTNSKENCSEEVEDKKDSKETLENGESDCKANGKDKPEAGDAKPNDLSSSENKALAEEAVDSPANSETSSTGKKRRGRPKRGFRKGLGAVGRPSGRPPGKKEKDAGSEDEQNTKGLPPKKKPKHDINEVISETKIVEEEPELGGENLLYS